MWWKFTTRMRMRPRPTNWSIDNKISIESPLGKAVRGHREGDRVMVRVNDTVSYPVVIKSIVKSTEDEDDQIRSF